MRCINIGDVVDINHDLEDARIPARIHLHDACAGQTCTIQAAGSVGNQDVAGILERARQIVTEHFSARSSRVSFDEATGLTFWLDR